MRTSYSNIDLNYGDLITSISSAINPSKIVEIGILDGYSLEQFINSSNNNTNICAYDLFEDFNGNHSSRQLLEEKFKIYNNVTIEYGDFYKVYELIDNIDIIHIDIANNGDVFEYAIKHYIPKLSKSGVMILEGGSITRDNVEWMKKYNKPMIHPILEKYKDYLEIKTFGTFPSLTLIRKK